MNYDFKFYPLRMERKIEITQSPESSSPKGKTRFIEERRIVASEEQWQRLVGYCAGCELCDEDCTQPKIYADLRPLLDGYEGPIFTTDMDNLVNQVCIPDGKTVLKPSAILTRFFQTIENTKASLYLDCGAWVEELKLHWPFLLMPSGQNNEYDWRDYQKFPTATIIGTDQAKLKAIKHLVAGTILTT